MSSDVHVYLQQCAAGIDCHMLAGYHTGEVVDSFVADIPAVHIVHLVDIFLKLPDFNLTLIYYKFEPRSWRGVFDTTLCDKIYQ